MTVPAWTGHVYETECFFPTWINKESAPHVQALVDAHHALWGTERIGADEKALLHPYGPSADRQVDVLHQRRLHPGPLRHPLRGLRPRRGVLRPTPRTRSPGSRISSSAPRSMPPFPVLYNPENKDGSATSFRQELTGNDIK